VWEAVAASGKPLTIHIGLGATMSGRMHRLKAQDLPGTVHFNDAPVRMLQFIFRKTINAAFANVPVDERKAILGGNAQRVFGFGRNGAVASSRDERRVPTAAS
jgi:hypothetical protein